jgi:hypothetical protein
MADILGQELVGKYLMLISAEGPVKYWKRMVRRGENSTEADIYQYQRSIGWEFETIAEIHGSFFEPSVVNDGVIFDIYNYFDEARRDFIGRVTRITPGGPSTILKTTGELRLCALDKTRMLIARSGERQFWIWDERHPEQIDSCRELPSIPVPAARRMAYLGNDEILYFTETKRPNADNPVYPERVLTLNRYDFSTEKHVVTALDGFGSVTNHNTQIYRNQPKQMICLKSFEGEVSVNKGHTDWWILNYTTRQLGSRTICWFWNQESEDIIKITSEDIPKHDVFVLYSPGLRQYLAFGVEFVAQLADLDRIKAAQQ